MQEVEETARVCVCHNLRKTSRVITQFYDKLLAPRWYKRSTIGFRKGTIGEIWKQVGPDGWFNPAFQKFINTEIVTGNR